MELRYIEEVILERTIVHVLDQNGDEPLLTSRELEMNEQLQAFVAQHIIKALSAEGNKKLSFFNPQGAAYRATQSMYDTITDRFVEASQEYAKWMFQVMQENPIVPSADLIVATFLSGGERFVALLKMDYQTSFVHDIQFGEAGFKVDLISQDISLPSTRQRLSKCAFIKLPQPGAEYDMVVIDRPLKSEDGTLCEYFTKQFLQASRVVDYMDKTRIVRDSMEKWIRRNMKDEVSTSIELRKEMDEAYVNGAEINPIELTEQMIDDTVKKEKFLEELERAGVDTDEAFLVDKKWVGKKFKTKAIKTDTGITIRGNFELFHDATKVQIIRNGDGTVDYIIKNVRNIQER